jgi:hypothetical protein
MNNQLATKSAFIIQSGLRLMGSWLKDHSANGIKLTQIDQVLNVSQ